MPKVNAPLVIVGTGPAGYGLLRALRRKDRTCDIVLITRDEGAAYSKAHITAGISRCKEAVELVLATAEQMSHRFDATVMTHTEVLTIDLERRAVTTARRRIPYSRLILATGAEPLRPRKLRGTAVQQVLTLASLNDYRYLRHELAGRRRVVILGGTIAGCEFADSLTRAGYAVTLLEPGSRLLGERLPALCASRLARLLDEAGIRIALEDGIARVDQGSDEFELTTLSGTHLRAEVVIAAMGSRPRTALARHAGLSVGCGVQVDPALSTGEPGVHAIGEVAEIGGRVFCLPEDIEAGCRVLADNLLGGNARMHWKPRLHRLQLEACPVVLCEPPRMSGEWEETATPRGVRAFFYDRHGELRGFVLVGDMIERAEPCLRRVSR